MVDQSMQFVEAEDYKLFSSQHYGSVQQLFIALILDTVHDSLAGSVRNDILHNSGR